MTVKGHSSSDAECILRGAPSCSAEEVLASHHQSESKTRALISDALQAGVGPTEAFEDVINEFNDVFLTKAAVKSQATRRRKREIVPDSWPRDVMQCLVLLRRTQKEEINPSSNVPGYIQVRLH